MLDPEYVPVEDRHHVTGHKSTSNASKSVCRPAVVLTEVVEACKRTQPPHQVSCIQSCSTRLLYVAEVALRQRVVMSLLVVSDTKYCTYLTLDTNHRGMEWSMYIIRSLDQ
jgi:hypothetical protein